MVITHMFASPTLGEFGETSTRLDVLLRHIGSEGHSVAFEMSQVRPSSCIELVFDIFNRSRPLV